MIMVRLLALAAAVVVVLGSAEAAVAAPPNDSPAGAGVFSPFSSPNGIPTQQEALADLATATPDAGVPRCLGAASFARTVWYRVPESAANRLVTVEATGQTTASVDLAAFVQPPVVTPTPTPVPTTTATPRRVLRQGTQLAEPNSCDGVGAGAGADTADSTSAVSMLLPAGYPVLFQVGRRGAVGTPTDEQAVVAFESTDVDLAPMPKGDLATAAPPASAIGTVTVNLAGATITGEDPAQPPCPSLGTVWRRLPVSGAAGKRLITVIGSEATTLTVFRSRRGGRPSGGNVMDCVVRRTRGRLQMNVDARRGQTLWIRLGVQRPLADDVARLSVDDGTDTTVINGGRGGFDPTPGGAAGGLPTACDTADATKTRLTGTRLKGRAANYNREDTVRLRVRVRGSALCDAQLRLIGPRGRVYASGRFPGLTTRTRRVRLPRRRALVPGTYRLRATGLNAQDRRVTAKTTLTGRLSATPRRTSGPDQT